MRSQLKNGHELVSPAGWEPGGVLGLSVYCKLNRDVSIVLLQADKILTFSECFLCFNGALIPAPSGNETSQHTCTKVKLLGLIWQISSPDRVNITGLVPLGGVCIIQEIKTLQNTPQTFRAAASQRPERCCSIPVRTEKSQRKNPPETNTEHGLGFCVQTQCGEQQTLVTLQGIYRAGSGWLIPDLDRAVFQTASADDHSSCFLAAGTRPQKMIVSFFAFMCDPCITLPGKSEETSAAQSEKIAHS